MPLVTLTRPVVDPEPLLSVYVNVGLSVNVLPLPEPLLATLIVAVAEGASVAAVAAKLAGGFDSSCRVDPLLRVNHELATALGSCR